MPGSGSSPRVTLVVPSRMDLSDVSGRVLFPSPVQGPWLPFQRFADTTTSGGGDDPEGHAHSEEEVLNYIVAGRADYEDDAGRHSVLASGSLELLTAREETRHKLTGQPQAPGTRWLSVVVRFPRGVEGPSRRFQVVTELTTIPAGESVAVRFLVGPDTPAQSGTGLECDDVEFQGSGEYVRPLGGDRRAVAYVYEGTSSIEGHAIEAGVGALIENSIKISLRGKPGTRVLLASVPRMVL